MYPPASAPVLYYTSRFQEQRQRAVCVRWRALQLYLNVYAPAVKPATPVPVMFWIFGGGFQGGGGNETRLNGTWDVALQKGELIVVT